MEIMSSFTITIIIGVYISGVEQRCVCILMMCVFSQPDAHTWLVFLQGF